MIEVTAKIRYVKISPKKLGLVARALKNKPATEAEWIIQSQSKAIKDYLWHAYTNALAMLKDKGGAASEAVVRGVRIDTGPRLKRFRPAARGRSSTYQHTLSHLTLVLADTQKKSVTRRPKEPSLKVKKRGKNGPKS